MADLESFAKVMPIPHFEELKMPPAFTYITARLGGRPLYGLLWFAFVMSSLPSVMLLDTSGIPAESPMAPFFSWYIESCNALFWALNVFPSLSYPDTATSHAKLYYHFFAGGLAQFRERARLRPAAEILDATDLYYCYFHVCKIALQQDAFPPGMIDRNVVGLRFAALQWLVGRGDWDEMQRYT